MTPADLDRLCSRLYRMEAGELYSLEDDDSVAIPQIRGMPVQGAVVIIRRHIAAIPGVINRMRCVCNIYAFLMKKGFIGPWVAYRVAATQGAGEVHPLTRFLMEVYLRGGAFKSMLVSRNHTHMFALVPQSNAPSGGLDVYGFCSWTSFACVAVFRPPEGYSHTQNEVLFKMFGDNPEAFECGTYDDLDSAHEAFTRLAPDGPSAEDVEEC